MSYYDMGLEKVRFLESFKGKASSVENIRSNCDGYIECLFDASLISEGEWSTLTCELQRAYEHAKEVSKNWE